MGGAIRWRKATTEKELAGFFVDGLIKSMIRWPLRGINSFPIWVFRLGNPLVTPR